MNRFHAEPVRSLIHGAIHQGLFPCAALAVRHGSRCLDMSYHGRHTFETGARTAGEKSFFDLASLTKPLVTALSCMLLVERGVLSLDERLWVFFRRIPGDKADISIRLLLCHAGGFRAHEKLDGEACAPFPGRNRLKRKRACHLILSLPLEYPPGSRVLYSDLGYILLGEIVERLTGTTPCDFVRKEFFSPLGIRGFTWQGEPGFNDVKKVPTGYCPARERMLEGQVHDANAWLLGGHAGHAGLFGTLEAVDRLIFLLVEAYSGVKNGFPVSRRTLSEFLRPAGIPPGSTWALGFDTPSPSGSTAGRYFSSRSVGHLGYTGTSFWVDLESDIFVIFLSNRTFPFDTMESRTAMKAFRMDLHDTIRRCIDRS